MNIDTLNKRKVIHLDALNCMIMSNTLEGSKSLREPSVNFQSISKPPLKNILPRKSRKRLHNGSQITGLTSDVSISESKSVDALSQPVVGTDVANVCQSIQKKHLISEDFVTAKELINYPTWNLNQAVDETKTRLNNNNTPTKSSMKSDSRRGRKICPSQSNSLDNYFKLKSVSTSTITSNSIENGWKDYSSDGKTFISSSQNSGCSSQSTHSTEGNSIMNSQTGSTTMHSPITKLPGSNNIYYGSPLSPSSETVETVNKCQQRDISQNVVKTLFDSDDFEIPCKNFKKINSSGVAKQKRKSIIGKQNSKVEKTVSDKSTEDKYGLFGFSEAELIALNSDSDFEDESCTNKVDYISNLPFEILENILCRLPFLDLCLNVNRVCLAWKDIVNSSEFVPWKMNYHCLIKDHGTALQDMISRLESEKMTSKAFYLPQLIRCMKNYKPVTAKYMNKSLSKHKKYWWAKELLQERFSDCLDSDKEPNAWCAIAALVILSDCVGDIQELLECMLGGQSECMACDLLNGLYCIASYLFTFKHLCIKDIWTSIHYRLYYALYLYENDSVSTSAQLAGALKDQKGQQSLRRYSCPENNVRLTHEQMRICNHNMQANQTIKIVAFAGTGKTTTLIEYARLRPGTKFLLIVYNRSVCDHAKGRFPFNVDCYTSHSLAFREIGRRYQFAGKLGNNIKVNEIVHWLDMRKGQSVYVQAKFVVDTLNRYMSSSDQCITTAHVPACLINAGKNSKTTVHAATHEMQMDLANDAQKIWEKMINVWDKSIKLPHDGYLKLWQLSKPVIRSYDVLMIDEAQDLTPAVADIFRSQCQPKIMVGDPHQQIYSFRGAVNAMATVQSTRTFYLTQSFRFGPEISFVANVCLDLLKQEKKFIVGNGKPDGVCGEQVGQLAIITRTNFTLFKEAVIKCCYSNEPIKVAFAGGTDSFGFDMIRDIYTLMTAENTESIKHPFIKVFVNQGFQALVEYARNTMDVELLGKINIVTTYMHLIPSHIQRILAKCVKDPQMADIIFSTAHKAKGLEFDTVKVTDDYMQNERNCSLGLPTTATVNEADEENLLYVAVTRAKKRLQMSPMLLTILERVGEVFNRLVPTKFLKCDSEPEIFCCHLGETFELTTKVSVIRKKFQLDGSNIFHKLYYSPEAVSKKMESLHYIAGVIEK